MNVRKTLKNLWEGLSSISILTGSSDKEEEIEEDDDDDDDDIDEEELIKQMLAKEELKLSQQSNTEDADEEENADHEDDNEQKEASSVVFNSDKVSEPSTSSNNLISSSVITVTASTAPTISSATTSNTAPSTEASSYPVSSNGRCPYCDSSDVKYIIIVSENTKDADLPQSLQKLLKRKQAFKMAKGEVKWVSPDRRERESYFLVLHNQSSSFQVVTCSSSYDCLKWLQIFEN